MHRWTVDDALTITARFADWLSTGDAKRATRQHVWSMVEEQFGPDDNPDQYAEESNALLARAIRSQDPIWCDPAMVDLLAVATAELPDVHPIQPWHLPHPTAGMVVFSKPIPTDYAQVYAWNDPQARSPDNVWRNVHDEVSAITWERPFTNRWLIRSWIRTRGTSIYRIENAAGPIWCPDLRPSSVVELMGEHHHGGPGARVLVALTALTRAGSAAAESAERASKAARRRADKAGMPEARVRRLYLNRPESGPAELDALRAHRHGTPRGHWVRGHWRHQWHPSVAEHRWQWIEGCPRGDFTKGTVTGDRMQVARGAHAG